MSDWNEEIDRLKSIETIEAYENVRADWEEAEARIEAALARIAGWRHSDETLQEYEDVLKDIEEALRGESPEPRTLFRAMDGEPHLQEPCDKARDLKKRYISKREVERVVQEEKATWAEGSGAWMTLGTVLRRLALDPDQESDEKGD